jgi:ABC-type spermidine/putrescine transport system permease subunit I
MQLRPGVAMLMAALPVAVIALFIFYPAIGAVLYTLGVRGAVSDAVTAAANHQIFAAHGITLQVYTSLLANTEFQQDMIVTLIVTAFTVGICVCVGYGVALFARFRSGPMAHWVTGLYLLPLFIPLVIASYALVAFFQPGGWLSVFMYHVLGIQSPPTIAFTTADVLVGEVWASIPFCVLVLTSGLTAINDNWLEAARDMGASPLTMFFRFILPLTRLQALIVATFTAIGVLGSFTVPYVTGPNAPQMLGVAMDEFYVSFGEPQQAEAMAVMLFIVAAIVGVPYVWAMARARTATRSG